jgi:multiple sugar transport system ATP-binding protein
MRGEIVDLHRRTGRTFIYVTHDQAEAMSMSDRIAVFMDGKIVQAATPRELFEQPETREVAAFVGDRPINLIELDCEGGVLPAPFDDFAIEGQEIPPRVVLGIRPETTEISAGGALSSQVERLEYLGSEAIVTFRLPGEHVIRATLDASQALPAAGETVRLGINLKAVHLFDAACGKRLPATLIARAGDSPGSRGAA